MIIIMNVYIFTNKKFLQKNIHSNLVNNIEEISDFRKKKPLNNI